MRLDRLAALEDGRGDVGREESERQAPSDVALLHAMLEFAGRHRVASGSVMYGQGVYRPLSALLGMRREFGAQPPGSEFLEPAPPEPDREVERGGARSRNPTSIVAVADPAPRETRRKGSCGTDPFNPVSGQEASIRAAGRCGTPIYGSARP